MEDVSKEEGVGESGVKAMIVDVDNQKTGYILLDSNNMVIGFRERIIKHLKELGLDEAEILSLIHIYLHLPEMRYDIQQEQHYPHRSLLLQD